MNDQKLQERVAGLILCAVMIALLGLAFGLGYCKGFKAGKRQSLTEAAD